MPQVNEKKSFRIGLVICSLFVLFLLVLFNNGFFFTVDSGKRISIPYPERLEYLNTKPYLTEGERDERETLLLEYKRNLKAEIEKRNR